MNLLPGEAPSIAQASRRNLIEERQAGAAFSLGQDLASLDRLIKASTCAVDTAVPEQSCTAPPAIEYSDTRT
jgi:hypothetical protein